MHPVHFKHQSVRDLAWAISSPPLIAPVLPGCIWPRSKWYRQIYDESLPWLYLVDNDPSTLEALLNEQKDRRLGKYFETLWLYWLQHNDRYQLVEKNLQVVIDGQTLGEIDFIVFDNKTRQMLHWEVAVKFYLGVADTRIMSNWYGPNCRDRLDIKVEHLIKRQSMISQDEKVRQWLKQQGIHIDHCAVILKGRLYYPWQLKSVGIDAASSPSHGAANHEYGWWLRPDQFEQEFDQPSCFRPLINQGWLEKIPTYADDMICSKDAIIETVSNKKYRLPLHLQLCNSRYDWDRVFLVGASWPEKNT